MSNNKNKEYLKKIAYAGVLTALIFVGTELHIPTAIGHINLGDAARKARHLLYARYPYPS